MNTTPNATASDQFVWPLPATYLPHAHLTWAEWIAYQAVCTSSRQPEIVKRDRAA